jgi:hypothetical protein
MTASDPGSPPTKALPELYVWSMPDAVPVRPLQAEPSTLKALMAL